MFRSRPIFVPGVQPVCRGFGRAGGGTPALIASESKASAGSDTVTTDAMDSSGTNFIVIAQSFYPVVTPAGGTITDSKGNTWTALTAYGAGNNNVRLHYCHNPIVGSGHTFTTNASQIYPAIFVAAFSNIASSPFDQENGAGALTVATLQSGSITPSQANTLVIAASGWDGNGGVLATINGGYTIVEELAYSPAEGGSLAYLILTAATAQNPTWTFGGTPNSSSAVIASFKY
jgi:hypothetical protein